MTQFEVTFRSSPVFAALLIALHVAAVSAIAPFLIKAPGIPLCTGVVLSLAWSVFSSVRVWRRSGSFALILPSAGVAEWRADGAQSRIRFLPACADLSGCLIVLYWETLSDGRRHSACLFPDSTDRRSWRHLRTWLRWQAFSPDRPSDAGS